MDASAIGTAIGVPLAVSSVFIVWLVIRAMFNAATAPGFSPALIPLALLSGVGMVLYASNPELTELAGISSVGVGAMATFLATTAQKIESIVPFIDNEKVNTDVTATVQDSKGTPPEDVVVPPEIEELGQ